MKLTEERILRAYSRIAENVELRFHSPDRTPFAIVQKRADTGMSSDFSYVSFTVSEARKLASELNAMCDVVEKHGTSA